MTPSALLSIHDVAPGTLGPIRRILGLLDDVGAPPATLLIVPGLRWEGEALETLRALARDGHPLAGHGWEHRAPPPRGAWHRLHALVLSRDQAEHLSRPRDELRRRVCRCHRWFGERGLEECGLYVPPAWALGALAPADLRALPFRWYETLTGFVDGATGRRRRLPLVGFEADTAPRRWTLRLWNGASVALGRRTGQPVRIALHPRDLELLLAPRAEALLRRPWNFVRVEDVMEDGNGRSDGGERPPPGGTATPGEPKSREAP